MFTVSLQIENLFDDGCLVFTCRLFKHRLKNSNQPYILILNGSFGVFKQLFHVLFFVCLFFCAFFHCLTKNSF